jgi:cobalt-zinc-cadmium efflux system outer membrane protein
MRDMSRRLKLWMHHCLPLAIGVSIMPIAAAQQCAPNALRTAVSARDEASGQAVSSDSGDQVRRLPPMLGPVTPPTAQRTTRPQSVHGPVQQVQQVADRQPIFGNAAVARPLVQQASPGPNWGPAPATPVGYPQAIAFAAPPSGAFRSQQELQDSNRGPNSGPSRLPLDRLKIPPGLPGADARPIELPPFRPDNQLEYSETIDRIFPRLPGPPKPAAARLGPGGEKMTYLQLLEIARQNSPLLRQYRADILAARGNAIDVGALPNPQIGFEMDTVGKLEPNQYVGGMVNQTVITAGKLRLQRSAALQDVRNRELDYRAADIDVATSVLSQYYAVLVAQEAMKATNALVQFTDETYRILVEQTKGGEAAAYEPLQLRVLATQARAASIQAYNRYISAWQQLTAKMAVPQMPPTELDGRVDAPTPDVCWDLAVDHVTRFHTNVLIAQTTIARQQFNLRREQVDPIPNINTYAAIQKDNTQPSDVSMNLQTYIALPIFYRNQGGILQAQGQLGRATQQVQQSQNELILRLAAIFERYQNARRILVLYRDQILPDQSRAYRGVFERHQQQPQIIAFGDVVVAQQILATTVNQYIAVLGDQWNALADLENVTQVLDLSILVENYERVPPPAPNGNAPADNQPQRPAPGPQRPPVEAVPPPAPKLGSQPAPPAPPSTQAPQPGPQQVPQLGMQRAPNPLRR